MRFEHFNSGNQGRLTCTQGEFMLGAINTTRLTEARHYLEDGEKLVCIALYVSFSHFRQSILGSISSAFGSRFIGNTKYSFDCKIPGNAEPTFECKYLIEPIIWVSWAMFIQHCWARVGLDRNPKPRMRARKQSRNEVVIGTPWTKTPLEPPGKK